MDREARRCKYILKGGLRCNAWALKSSDRCFNHDPSTRQEKLMAVKKGGAANEIKVNVPLQVVEVKRAEDVVTLLVVVISELREGKIAPQIANTLGFLSAQLLRAFEITQLSTKIEEVRAVIVKRKTLGP